ncbi:alkylated DNA repair protein alkB 5 [Dendrobium catenatum]|uniref:Alkylated DNA repair protein alkB 5 n=1 Tax=Dendrobium catenatum TaxID=906689 RepID=A0A2I0X8G5_9ASPA|nr:alkylated DNA repair protein alkB 5 [Dendrobium catenatum]
MIRRLITLHVLLINCVHVSCIINIYKSDDCIPPHINNHDFVRPFSTLSFLSKCNIMFGHKLKIIEPDKFNGSASIPL